MPVIKIQNHGKLLSIEMDQQQGPTIQHKGTIFNILDKPSPEERKK